MRLRMLLAGGAATIAALGLTTAPSGAADQESTGLKFGRSALAWDCPQGYVCFYSGADGTGAWCGSEVSIANSGCGARRSFFNNGYASPGQDHVRVYNSANYTGAMHGCLHYGWAEGRGNFAGAVNIGSYRWGGEC
ncbi:peptidase inhibitor family I36 protein [Streptomyces massasporeus]|uniref:peptidase inhibitor family I36 protein n=1 Tax=Streptomyces massasporeus TaxID=67324 RepID=UPI001677308F|nr:peptidase inhibitor family I36 protein [Streptomyces massasporeus]